MKGGLGDTASRTTWMQPGPRSCGCTLSTTAVASARSSAPPEDPGLQPTAPGLRTCPGNCRLSLKPGLAYGLEAQQETFLAAIEFPP